MQHSTQQTITGIIVLLLIISSLACSISGQVDVGDRQRTVQTGEKEIERKITTSTATVPAEPTATPPPMPLPRMTAKTTL